MRRLFGLAGTPEEIASCESSYTGKYLRKVLKNEGGFEKHLILLPVIVFYFAITEVTEALAIFYRARTGC